METKLPIDLLHWGLANIPLVLVAVLLIGLGKSAAVSGLTGALSALAVAVVAFRVDWQDMLIAAGKGAWDALFVLYVVWPALLLYLMAERAGAFEALRQGIERFSRDELFQVLALGWVFASFLQGISGFGTPIAVVAPLLLAIGVRPLYAVAIPLIGHAWATMFGSIAVTWLATQRVIEMADPNATAWQTALLLWIPDILAGIGIAWLVGRGRALKRALPLVLVISAIHGGVQLVLAFWQPVVSNFIAGSIALAALYPLGRWRRYREAPEGTDEYPAISDQGRRDTDRREPVMGIGMAFLPYAILTAVAVTVLLVPGVESQLEKLEFGIPFPRVDTGFGVTREAKDAYSPMSPLTHPGFFLLVACAFTWGTYRAKRYLQRDSQDRVSLWGSLKDKALPASLAILAFLVMSKLLDHSGQIRVVALGISEVIPAMAYASLASAIGALGAFITSSSTASNLLFAPLQQTVAETEGLPGPTIIAAQSAGGALGNAIAPTNMVLGTSTADIAGREGQVLRRTLPWALIAAVTTGLGTLALLMIVSSAAG